MVAWRPSMRRVESTPLIAAALAALAAWFSIGSLALATAATGSRFGFLPPFWLMPVLAIAFVGGAWGCRMSTPVSLPLFFSLVLLLPWIPGPMPAAFLLWTGPIAGVVWIAVIVAMAIVGRTVPVALRTGAERVRGPILPAAIAFVAYLAAGWWLSPILPGGDEPHYLAITQSLLRDGDCWKNVPCCSKNRC